MINNFYGVEAGDRLLVYISGLIETYWQDVENCVFGRIDGDVFGICFPKDEKKLNGFILYIKRELKKYKAAYYLETAMGIYDILDNNLDVRNIIARATLAAKQCKGQYMIHEARYTEELRAKIIREQNIINEMEHALETGEFVVYFQHWCAGRRRTVRSFHRGTLSLYLKVTDLLSGLITMYGIRCASLLRIIWLTEGIPK